MDRGRVQILWLWSPASLSTDENGDPHETNLKGERSGEMGWSMVSKSEACLGVGAVRIYSVHNWKLGSNSLGESSVVLPLELQSLS